MELTQSGEFEKDVKRLDGGLRQRLKKALEKIASNPQLGKPLEHAPRFHSERIGGKRLIYRIREQDILLVCFKDRDEVYEFLRSLL